MIRCTDEEIGKRFKNYDIKSSKSVEGIETICEPDMLSLVADCLFQYSSLKKKTSTFSVLNIYNSKYATENVLGALKKDGLSTIKQKNEYHKLFKGSMDFLSVVGILSRSKSEAPSYRIVDKEMLEFLAINVKNCLRFLNLYVNKLIKDCGLNKTFELYFINPNDPMFEKIRVAFTDYVKKYTGVTTTSDLNKLFGKVLNILAYNKKARGMVKGKITKEPIALDMLMYNKEYYKDSVKTFSPDNITPLDIYRKYVTRKAKKFIIHCNDIYRMGKSEVVQKNQKNEKATAAHHIFPEGRFPSIAEYYENQIVITNDQHLKLAHPDGDIQSTDSKFQRICLFAKISIIKESIEKNEGIYSFANLIKVLSIGLNTDTFNHIMPGDYTEVEVQVNSFYSQM